MTEWDYFAIVDPPRESVDQPGGIFRREKGCEVKLGHVLHRSGEWFPSDLPYRHFIGKSQESELYPIDRSAAVAFAEAQHRRGSLESIPDDLVEE